MAELVGTVAMQTLLHCHCGSPQLFPGCHRLLVDSSPLSLLAPMTSTASFVCFAGANKTSHSRFVARIVTCMSPSRADCRRFGTSPVLDRLYRIGADGPLRNPCRHRCCYCDSTTPGRASRPDEVSDSCWSEPFDPGQTRPAVGTELEVRIPPPPAALHTLLRRYASRTTAASPFLSANSNPSICLLIGETTDSAAPLRPPAGHPMSAISSLSLSAQSTSRHDCIS